MDVAENWQIFVRLITLSNTDRFSNFFTVRIRTKFVILLSQKISPHPKYVATLPCEMCLKPTVHKCA